MNPIIIGIVAIVAAYLYYKKYNKKAINLPDLTKDPEYTQCTALLQHHGIDINNISSFEKWMLRSTNDTDKQIVVSCLTKLGNKAKNTIKQISDKTDELIQLAVNNYRQMAIDCKNILEQNNISSDKESILQWLDKNNDTPDKDTYEKINKCNTIISLSEADIHKLINDQINDIKTMPSTGSVSSGGFLPNINGVINDPYYSKYMKYKSKYQNLKNI
jgi:hypothetical protein